MKVAKRKGLYLQIIEDAGYNHLDLVKNIEDATFLVDENASNICFWTNVNKIEPHFDTVMRRGMGKLSELTQKDFEFVNIRIQIEETN